MPSTTASLTKKEINNVLRAQQVYHVISQFRVETGWERIFLFNNATEYMRKYTERFRKQFCLLVSESDGAFLPPEKALQLPDRAWWSVRRDTFSYDIRTTESREVATAQQKGLDLLEHAMYDPVETGKRERPEGTSGNYADTVSNVHTEEEDPTMADASSFTSSGLNASSARTNHKSGLNRSAKRRKVEHGQELQDDSLESKSQTDSRACTMHSSTSLQAEADYVHVSEGTDDEPM